MKVPTRHCMCFSKAQMKETRGLGVFPLERTVLLMGGLEFGEGNMVGV